MFYCGIDIAKYKHEASVIDTNGKAMLDSISFTNDKQGCEKILAVFQKFEISPADVIIGMEATGHYWLSVYTFFLELVAFAGLDVTVKQSGEFSGSKNKISKRGSPYLRRAIWLAAQRAAFCDPILSEYYQSLRARGKHHLTAIGGVARKLCNIIFVILKENRPYLPMPPKNPQNIT